MKAIAAKKASHEVKKKRNPYEQMAVPGRTSFFPSSDAIMQRKPGCSCGGGCPRCRGIIQTKLMINEPGDIHEQEADRIADQVMATPGHQAVSGVPPRIQRFSGQSNGQMDSAPASVDQVLASPGRPLEQALRQDMEQRFGHDFSRVRLHSGGAEEKSAEEVNALAYTVGQHIVFGAGQYAPHALTGKRLLAHELTHVMQVSMSAQGSKHSMFRLIAGSSRCPGGINSAPDDSTTELEAIDARVGEMSQTVSDQVGLRPPAIDTLQAYEGHFGLPPAVRGGFLNRLTGTVRSNKEVATNEELGILSRRFALVARLFGQPIQYLCAGDPASVAHAGVPNCEAFAWATRGLGQVVVCPRFWNDAADNDERAAVLLHEAFHIIWGPHSPRNIGEIGENHPSRIGRSFCQCALLQ